MNTYFVQDESGKMLGWIDASNEADAAALAETLYGNPMQINSKPAPDWQIRREAVQEKSSAAFAA